MFVFRGVYLVSCLADYTGTYLESVCISLPLPGKKWGRKLSEFSINYVLVLQNQRVMMHHHSYWESVLTGFNLKLGSGRKKHGICIVACCFSEPVYRHEYRFFINNISINIESYCWWKKSCTTWNVENPANNGINYQPQLVSRISSINSIIYTLQDISTNICQPWCCHVLNVSTVGFRM